MEEYKDLNEKLQMLYTLIMEITEIAPSERKCSYRWEEFFEECANLRDSFENLGVEDSVVPKFSEIKYFNVEIVMICRIDNRGDIGAVFDNFYNNCTEVENKCASYEDYEDGFTKFTWKGVAESDDIDKLIRLTHHAEGIYRYTSAEHVHVEVCIDGTWYGKVG